MQVLTVDIGTGTQDILLYDSEKTIENCFQMVLPSPTLRLAQAVKAATQRGKPILVTGVLMGGGPVAWAVRDHARAGFPVYALPDPARTFDDDPRKIAEMGVTLISEDEAAQLPGQVPGLVTLKFGDLDYQAISDNFRRFGLEFNPDALALAVFDHGDAPPEISDRKFRFDYIRESLSARNNLAAFAFLDNAIPGRLTRFEGVARSVRAEFGQEKPVLLMDTGPAAALGALDDPLVSQPALENAAILANLGNFHALAFLIEEGKVCGTFEHHTGELQPEQLGHFLAELAGGTLSNEEIFDSQGHGAVYFSRPAKKVSLLAVTGPRRGLLRDQKLSLGGPPQKAYFAVPHGAMMLAGNYGLLHALEYHCPGLDLNLKQALEGYQPPSW